MDHTPILLGGILGSIIPIILFVSLVICCVALCSFLCRKCRKGSNQRPQTVTNTTVVYAAPQQPISPPGYQQSCPGYQIVPAQPGYGGQFNPTAPPPSYLEATNPAHSSAAFSPGQTMYPFPSTAHAPPPQSDGLAQPPYNPSYDPKP